MSIIENALKKAGSQGLVVENNSQESATTAKPDRGFSETNLESTGLRESSGAFSPEQQVVVDWASLAENGFIDNNNAKSQLAEEFRVIKRPLVNNIQGAENNGINRSNLILICSSLPGEGKTFVSINLALSIANERDKKVLLIDADVEKPSISKQLGINSPRGLIEYLEDDKVTFSDILLKTDLPNLSLITAGKRHKYSTELLSSQRMYLFAEEVSRRYKDRIVIFDSPPLLVATQAQILAELVGQVVLVIAAEVTPQSVVNESVAKLSNCDVVMTLLNKTRKEIDIYGHNYSYGKYGHL
ncbi:polysaccharide biosynthesis tyrosine autokinase [Methylomonas sp. EFPC1]|uniref:non-specific protein-tyrosine kinase n=1 Tax=Methylomonas defluvii TaxID=3045149 RepID=A0ABU4UJG4_9GAMM|nr:MULTISPECIES: XrtA-associated tyrosine autokinase [unclassified Methylomonas]MDX8129525.1 XrtA-associated tyrosine autokinase [Methylomonas sp. OY6]QSB00400.1 polysaccharide biosynthesis tyrosine autokinase [Methylomonas sp. EFPC1]